MYCTGGIRCEKATAFMKEQGFDEVYHLKGGILKYLEQVPEEDSLWEGACFVFDDRVSVTHGLKEGEHILCRACRQPLTAEDVASPLYEEGVTCPHCAETQSETDRQRFRERQRQIALAKKRGQSTSEVRRFSSGAIADAEPLYTFAGIAYAAMTRPPRSESSAAISAAGAGRPK